MILKEIVRCDLPLSAREPERSAERLHDGPRFPDRTAGHFPLAVWESSKIRNGEGSVAFKTVEGVVDQAAGIVWRYRDNNNYYIVRANALEDNVVLYKVEK